MTQVSQQTVKSVDVAGLRIFYREAGEPSQPTIILHGFPSSSHKLSDLIQRYRF
jgi:pimeloyl-ACP methyl ester carboxylesterase